MALDFSILSGEPFKSGAVVGAYSGESYPQQYILSASGGVAVSGSAQVAGYYLEYSAGGTQFSGSAGVVAYNANTGLYDVVPWVAPTPTGGVQLGYGAGVGEKLSADLTYGGVQLSGASGLAWLNVRHWPEAGYGGLKFTATAVESFDWINAWPPTGGLAASGTATVSTVTITKLSAVEAGSGGFALSGLVEAYQPGINAALPVITASITASFVNPNTGVIASALPAVSVALSGAAGVGGSIIARLPRHSADLAAIAGVMATVDVTLPAITVDFEAGGFGIEALLPTVQANLTASAGVLAEIAVTLPSVSATLTTTVANVATVSASLPRIDAYLSPFVAAVAVISATLRAPTASLNALLGTNATLSAALTSISTQLGALQQVVATITVTLPSMVSTATATMPFSQVATYITNTITSAVTTYENFPFNSFAEIDGKYYGAGPAGLFELVGDKDVTTDIDATLALGALHFGSEMQKRMSDFFIAMRSDGDITLRVSVDEREPFEYTLSPLDIETLKQRRTLIGKGAKGKYWQFELANTAGCDFDFDSLNAAAVVLGRRL